MERNKKIHTAIVILSVLLVISLLAIAGLMLYNHFKPRETATVTVSDNLITPDEEKTQPVSQETADNKKTDKSNGKENGKNSSSASAKKNNAGNNNNYAQGFYGNPNIKTAAKMKLYNRQPKDNIPFEVQNMLPGDSETKYFGVQVSYCNALTVNFRATVRDGYEKLAEVMKIRIKLLSTDEIVYDGLMRDMPSCVTYKLYSEKDTTEEFYYEITAYLDTSVGNEYQNKDLVADFNWLVEEVSNLVSPPRTGSMTHMAAWSALAVSSAFVIVILLIARKRKEDDENA